MAGVARAEQAAKTASDYMERFAAQLAAAPGERKALLARRAPRDDVELAYALKALYARVVNGDPPRAAEAASALDELAAGSAAPEAHAVAAWTAGLAAIQIHGRLPEALAKIDAAAAAFEALGKSHTAAETQVGKLIALAMLGRYDEAIACGRRARDVFVAHGDISAAGRIEQNLGNIHFRRDQYREAEEFYRAARARYLALDDQSQLAQIENNLATALKWQHDFRAAAPLYEQALARARDAGLEVTEAEIERNLGVLALFQGDYGRALDYLERARRRWAGLGMAHRSAATEQELADAYLELNLAPEAAAIYERITPIFASLGMQGEHAAALARHAQAGLLLGDTEHARERLAQARTLYAAEGNAVGEAVTSLVEAQLCYAEGDFAGAAAAATRAEGPLEAAGGWRRLLLARWLHGEAARALEEHRPARSLLERTLRDAQQHTVPEVAQRCYTSLGQLAAAVGDREGAAAAFGQAIALIENLRSPLPAEEFRMAFVADKLTPYVEMARLCLAGVPPPAAAPDRKRAAEALGYVERARSRALLDLLGGALPHRAKARDAFEAELLARLHDLRAELNWFYHQMNQARGAEAMRPLQEAVHERERAVQEITRQLAQRGGRVELRVALPDIARLQQDLGADTALVEYFALDGELLAFVVTQQGVQVVRGLGAEAAVAATIGHFRFQVEALRHGAERLRPHLPQLARRVRHYLQALYDVLLRPLESHVGDRRLAVVPHRALHYVPFHALHDGAGYVVERREVCYAPSAGVLGHCLAMPRRIPQRAVLLGVPDEQIPRVRDEVLSLAPLFPSATTLLDERATLDALRAATPGADVVHLACHGQFRPDNPLFSSLRLADGWLTVRDAYDLDLDGALVTLSACETGISAVAPGDDLLGLARGFLSAGAPTLVVTLWTVDDESTATLMADFYARVRSGHAPAAALRHAQRRLLQRDAHPFFWAPFMLLGRW